MNLGMRKLPYLPTDLPMSSLSIYMSAVCRVFIAGAASEAGKANSSRAPGLAPFVFIGSLMPVVLPTPLLVPQWQCICSFVFTLIYIFKQGAQRATYRAPE